MGSAAVSIFGGAVLALLLAGYLAQHYLPPPKPRVVGIDLGTTYSCVGIYHAITGQVDVIKDREGHQCIPSIVAFSEDSVVVGYSAAAQSEQNAANTIYDAKRFIGKKFTKKELQQETLRYPFKVTLDQYGQVRFTVGKSPNITQVSPQDISAHILRTLRVTAEANVSQPVTKAVISVPAEFDERQRNYTRLAAKQAGLEVFRIINEPTAAALAYGLHKKEGIHYVMVIDLGGGTLDVSLLNIQGGMFLTQAMAGNNHLGGQDFNERILAHLQAEIRQQFKMAAGSSDDLQRLRQAAEDIKLNLTANTHTEFQLLLNSVANNQKPVIFKHSMTRQTFEELNEDLFMRILEPVDKVLEFTVLPPHYIDEIVLVGGSTRIPKVRELIRDYFQKEPNTEVDPELAVATGVAIQAGILGGMWPLTVSATEIPTSVRKIQIR